MDRSFHYLLLAAHGLFQQAAMGELSALGLSEGQARVLDYLGQHDGSIQRYIGRGCQLEPPALEAVLGRMEAKGLIQRRSRKEEEYALYVHLTPKGWDRQQLVRHTLERLESAVLKGMDPEEVAAMKDGLAEVCLLLSEGGEDLQ